LPVLAVVHSGVRGIGEQKPRANRVWHYCYWLILPQGGFLAMSGRSITPAEDY
jgi:hypothetical protein